MTLRQNNNTNTPSRRSRLSVRIPVFVLLFSFIVAIGATVVQLFIEYEKEAELIHARMKQMALSSTSVLAVSIWKLDEEQVRLQLNSLLQIPDMRYMKVESSDLGEIILGIDPVSNMVTQSYPLIHEIETEQIQVGTLQVSASLEGVFTRLQDRAFLIMSTEVIKTFLVSAFILVLIHYLVTRHLTRMASYARTLNIASLNKKLTLASRGKYHKIDELDELVTAINSMLVDLRQTHTRLQRSHDTLEQKVNERTKELTLAKEDAEKASQAKSEFLSTINHELRTPLTSILGGLSLVNSGTMGDLPEKMVSPVNIALRNSERLLLLVNDVLDVAKIEAGHLVLEYEDIQLKPFLEQAITLNDAYAESFDVKLSLIACPDNLIMHVDEHRLQQVMNNLISNAIKFTHTGDVIEVSAKQSDSSVEICVVDHGNGIPEELKKHIFEKFTQADSSDNRTVGGTGLGLSISKSIVALHNGSIDFTSTLGKGTSFYIKIPINRPVENK